MKLSFHSAAVLGHARGGDEVVVVRVGGVPGAVLGAVERRARVGEGERLRGVGEGDGATLGGEPGDGDGLAHAVGQAGPLDRRAGRLLGAGVHVDVLGATVALADDDGAVAGGGVAGDVLPAGLAEGGQLVADPGVDDVREGAPVRGRLLAVGEQPAVVAQADWPCCTRR